MIGTFAVRRHDVVRSRRPAVFASNVSMVCSGAHTEEPEYQRWLPALGQENGRHRKVWEWCFMLQQLDERHLLRSGVNAVGFGVGSEPLVAALAARGVEVLATDQPVVQAGAWRDSGQHAAAIDDLHRPDLCPPEVFDAQVVFREVDMRSIPADLVDFDVAWSSCCFEHLGSPDLGFHFVLDSMATLRPGGVAVHTTEIDCGRGGGLLETGTVPGGDYVCFYRVADLRRLVRRLRRSGHLVNCNFHVSSTHSLEQEVDAPPYSHDPHLRLRVADRVVTSFGLVVTKPPVGRWRPRGQIG